MADLNASEKDTTYSHRNLKTKSARGGLFTLCGQLATFAIGLIATPILARTLAPEDFGVVGMASSIVGVLHLFSDGGLSNATIQRKDITEHQISNLFWISIAAGLILSLLTVMIVAPLAVYLYSEPKVASVAYIAAIGFIFAGLQVQPIALLKRSFRFATISIVMTAVKILSAVATVAIAINTKSYLALAIGPVIGTALQSITIFYISGWRPDLPKRGVGTKKLFSFGANVTGFSLINYFSRNADNILIGTFLGAQPLGYYSKAYALMLLPISQLNAPFTAVALPMLSQLQDSPEKYRQAYKKTIRYLLLLTTPLGVIGLFSGGAVIDIFLGPNWGPAKPIFAVLSINCILQPLFNSTGWLFQSQNRTPELLRWGLISSPCFVLSFLAGLPFGPLGVAYCYSVAMVLVTPFLFAKIGKSGPVSQKNLYSVCIEIAQQLTSCCAFACIPLLFSLNLSPGIRLITCCLMVMLGSIFYLILSKRISVVWRDLTQIVFSQTA